MPTPRRASFRPLSTIPISLLGRRAHWLSFHVHIHSALLKGREHHSPLGWTDSLSIILQLFALKNHSPVSNSILSSVSKGIGPANWLRFTRRILGRSDLNPVRFPSSASPSEMSKFPPTCHQAFHRRKSSVGFEARMDRTHTRQRTACLL